jgi:hypothetical protein
MKGLCSFPLILLVRDPSLAVQADHVRKGSLEDGVDGDECGTAGRRETESVCSPQIFLCHLDASAEGLMLVGVAHCDPVALWGARAGVR